MQIASLLFATLELITREQDVITSLMTYYISHALPSHWMTGGIFQSKAALRNWALTENKCLTYFWKGLAIWYPLCTAESALKLGKQRRRVFSFSCNVMFESNLCFMLLWCLRKERHCMCWKFVVTHMFLFFLEMNNTEWNGRKINMIWRIIVKPVHCL